jgi:hypothetical protein
MPAETPALYPRSRDVPPVEQSEARG